MKRDLLLLFALTCIIFLSSCSAIAGIFKAGVGTGIFIVVLVIIVILFFVLRGSKKE